MLFCGLEGPLHDLESVWREPWAVADALQLLLHHRLPLRVIALPREKSTSKSCCCLRIQRVHLRRTQGGHCA